MKRTVKDVDGDLAVVKGGRGYTGLVVLRLVQGKPRFGEPLKEMAQIYRLGSARRLAKNILKAADASERQKRKYRKRSRP